MKRIMFLSVILMTTAVSFGQSTNNPDNELSPKAVIGGYASGDSIARSSFISQAGVGVFWNSPRHTAATMQEPPAYRYSVSSFHLTVLHNGITVFSGAGDGNNFSAKTKSFFSSLEKGDVVVVTDIKAVWGNLKDNKDLRELALKPLLYIIK